ncbi:hypothetical protein [Aquimarina sp. MMG016]|uniref:hypothetical protein n=1 Tax=Aquimarina sp. MMG016 TaxID=2822690 RepID=UPI001B3A46D1|nr:hypothetical protein [Aquimarina sp. MMG016]MBQ4821644.1 hypothetical protein [Aquimarina sp. MMG016]
MKVRHLSVVITTMLLCIQCKNHLETNNYSKEQDEKLVQMVLEVLDDVTVSTEDKMEVWVDDLVHMAPNHSAITNKTELIEHINNEKQYGCVDMKHEIVEMHSFEKVVVMHGKVTGTFYPINNNAFNRFETKNLFVFRRMEDNSLKIWKVIFNMTS